LRQSPDEVISTLENAGKRKKLLKQLKNLRTGLPHGVARLSVSMEPEGGRRYAVRDKKRKKSAD